jgi:DNA-binding NtrC family response regulator
MARACHDIAVLLIDDDTVFRILLAGMLRDDHHEVMDFAPLPVLPSRAALHRVAVVIAGERLGDEDGTSFADRIHAHRPDMPVLLTIPCRTPALDARVASRRQVHLLEKPVDYDALHARLHELVG